MAKFGGYSRFGGGTHFGGDETAVDLYHRILRSLEPPGVFDETPGTIRDQRLETYASGLGTHGQETINRLLREFFPRLCEESISEWSSILRERFRAGATLQQKQSTLYARWIAQNGLSLPDIRAVLAPLINPSIGFWDRFDTTLSHKLTARDGDGATLIGSSIIRLYFSAAATCGWEIVEDDCPRITGRIVDQDDDYIVWSLVEAVDSYNSQGGGVCLLLDGENAVAVEAWRTGGADTVWGWQLSDSGQTFISGTSITLPAWLGLSRSGDSVQLLEASDPDDSGTWTVLGTLGLQFVPREFGIYCRNDSGSYPAGYAEFNDLRVDYATGRNNVELCESPNGATDKIFKLFCHIDDEDPAVTSVDLSAVRRLGNSSVAAHCVFDVGREDCFRLDDPSSLLDRDVFGV